MRSDELIPKYGDYNKLAVYQIATLVYAITRHFTDVCFSRGDRTIDQMVQAARSAKQNIAEGSVDGATSSEMEIKLMNVARGSMHELQADYEDFLLHNRLQQWTKDDPRTLRTRAYTRVHRDTRDFLDKIQSRSPETVANIALTLIHQYDYLMARLLKSIEARFLANGGFKEQMYNARVAARRRQQLPPSPPSSPSSPSSQPPPSSPSSQR